MQLSVPDRKANALEICSDLTKAIQREYRFKHLPIYAAESDHLVIAVDSSEAGGRYTVGVLITSLSSAASWYRASFLPWNRARKHPDQRLSYKTCRTDNDDNIIEALEYLQVADKCPGLLLTVNTPSLGPGLVSEAEDVKVHPDLEDFRSWSPTVFERLMRTSCAVGIGMGLFCSHPERWLLLHDNDEMFEGNRRTTAQIWLSSFVSTARDGELTPIQLTTKDEVPDPLVGKAILGVPDYVAGAAASALKAWRDLYGDLEGKVVGAHGDLLSKDANIACWLAMKSQGLLKISCSYGDNTNRFEINQFGVEPRQRGGD